MQAIQSSLSQKTSHQPTYYTSASSHIKQYWPVWIYKTSFIGAGVSQYLMNRWDIALGFAGCGLVASYVGAYFLGSQERPLTPEAISDYEAQNQENIANLSEVRDDLNESKGELGKQIIRTKSGLFEQKETEKIAVRNNQQLKQLLEGEKEEISYLRSLSEAGREINQELDLMEAGEKQQVEILKKETGSLKRTISAAQLFLENRNKE